MFCCMQHLCGAIRAKCSFSNESDVMLLHDCSCCIYIYSCFVPPPILSDLVLWTTLVLTMPLLQSYNIDLYSHILTVIACICWASTLDSYIVDTRICDYVNLDSKVLHNTRQGFCTLVLHFTLYWLVFPALLESPMTSWVSGLVPTGLP